MVLGHSLPTSLGRLKFGKLVAAVVVDKHKTLGVLRVAAAAVVAFILHPLVFLPVLVVRSWSAAVDLVLRLELVPLHLAQIQVFLVMRRRAVAVVRLCLLIRLLLVRTADVEEVQPHNT